MPLPMGRKFRNGVLDVIGNGEAQIAKDFCFSVTTLTYWTAVAPQEAGAGQISIASAAMREMKKPHRLLEQENGTLR